MFPTHHQSENLLYTREKNSPLTNAARDLAVASADKRQRFFGSMLTGQNNASTLPVEPTTINRENINSISTDGDVMFLEPVQENSLKVEGNTIQIRNPQNIADVDGNVLTGDKVKLFSNNPKAANKEAFLIKVANL